MTGAVLVSERHPGPAHSDSARARETSAVAERTYWPETTRWWSCPACNERFAATTELVVCPNCGNKGVVEHDEPWPEGDG